MLTRTPHAHGGSACGKVDQDRLQRGGRADDGGALSVGGDEECGEGLVAGGFQTAAQGKDRLGDLAGGRVHGKEKRNRRGEEQGGDPHWMEKDSTACTLLRFRIHGWFRQSAARFKLPSYGLAGSTPGSQMRTMVTGVREVTSSPPCPSDSVVTASIVHVGVVLSMSPMSCVRLEQL